MVVLVSVRNVVVFCVLFLLVGCSSVPQVNPTVSSTTVPSRATQTSTVTPTPTLQLTKTPTVIPTLTLDDSIDYVQELMKTNGGCELPCFWGITAGETTWEEALQILGPIGLVTDFRGEELLFNKYVFFLALKELGQYPEHGFYVENGIVEMISFSDLEDSPYAEIPQIHNILGIPEEVWINTLAEGQTPTVTNIDIANVYLDEGIATLHDYGAHLEGNMATSCLDKGSSMLLAIWNPDLQFSIEDVEREFNWRYGEFRFSPLSEVTSLDEESFYIETQQDEGYCIQTPNDLWFP